MGEDRDIPHFRLLCPSNTSPNAAVIPCGDDHGRGRGERDPDNPNSTRPLINEDGFIAEMSQGEISALVAWQATLPPPVRRDDLSHPLAGQAVTFEVHVIGVL